MRTRWRDIPGWQSLDERGYQLSDCGRIRNTEHSTYQYNDWDEVIGVEFEEIEFEPFHIFMFLDGPNGWQEDFFTFDEVRAAVAEGRPPVPKKTPRVESQRES